MGRHPIPTKIKKLQGTHRADRAQKNEPEADLRSLPMPPDTLNTDGQQIYIQTCAKLLTLDMLTVAGLPQIERYSYAYQMWKAAISAMNGGKYLDDAEKPKISPWVSILEKAQRTMNEFEDRWGLSPVSQQKVNWKADESNGKNEEEDEFDI